MIHFKLDSNWKILSVIRCSNSHATLSVQHIYSGEIKVLSIYAKEHFQHKLYFDTLSTDIYCQYHKYS